MKAVLISIKPKYCELIANGNKTMEVRKSRPNIATPFKCYIYCTLPDKKTDWDWQYKPYLYVQNGKLKWIDTAFDSRFKWEFAHQKIIGEFICNGIMQPSYLSKVMAKQSCLTEEELFEYSNGKQLYGWRISELKIYDKPKELKEFKGLCQQSCLNCKYVKYYDNLCNERGTYQITRPPQSWCYVKVHNKEGG